MLYYPAYYQHKQEAYYLMNVIKGEALSLNKFLQEYDFTIPSYQRPYSWTQNETSELFDDLYTFWSSNPVDNEQYFLGSIVLDTSDGGKTR